MASSSVALDRGIRQTPAVTTQAAREYRTYTWRDRAGASQSVTVELFPAWGGFGCLPNIAEMEARHQGWPGHSGGRWRWLLRDLLR